MFFKSDSNVTEGLLSSRNILLLVGGLIVLMAALAMLRCCGEGCKLHSHHHKQKKNRHGLGSRKNESGSSLKSESSSVRRSPRKHASS